MQRSSKMHRGICVGVTMAVIFLFFCLPFLLPQRPTVSENIEDGYLAINVIDVGQGDAILLRTAHTAVLIDTGTNESEDALRAYLLAAGVSRLDYLILTHLHEDHMGGADMILREFEVGMVLLSDAEPDEDVGARFTAAYAASDAQAQITKAGDLFTIGEMSVLILSPPAGGFAASNDNSLVLRMTYGEISMLFTGDAEETVEQWLLETYDTSVLDCDFLKAGHHGSDTSNTEEFLKAVSPRYVAISCGEANTYNHPAQRVLDSISAVGARSLRTDREGTLTFITDGDTIWYREKS